MPGEIVRLGGRHILPPHHRRRRGILIQPFSVAAVYQPLMLCLPVIISKYVLKITLMINTNIL
jgi:hypothetical protein